MSKEAYFFIILNHCYVKIVNIIRRAAAKAPSFIDSASEPNVKYPRLCLWGKGQLTFNKITKINE
ncbi:hypothetical protein BK026_05600 [Alteromonas sp. V450]|nr:hypothetical protein BK026_05600 [Alteromonas sp. V450]